MTSVTASGNVHVKFCHVVVSEIFFAVVASVAEAPYEYPMEAVSVPVAQRAQNDMVIFSHFRRSGIAILYLIPFALALLLSNILKYLVSNLAAVESVMISMSVPQVVL